MSLPTKHRLTTFVGVMGSLFVAVSSATAQDRADAPDFSDEPDSSAPENPAEELAPEVVEALESIANVIAALDADAKRRGNNWELTHDDRTLLVVTDTGAARMRIISPIAEVSALPDAAMERLLQANFDTALDARYAVAQGLVWSVFLHPLDSLTTRDFASGILQTKSLADTFGTTFSSGALNYGGGDSGALIDEQLKELLEELEKRDTV